MRESLFAFHAQHYSANAMRLVVVGREELDTLQAWVVPLFSKVPNIDRPPPVWPTPPYGAAQLGRELKVVPVRDLRSLSVWWALPPLHPLYRSKPHRILSHLIGHEGALRIRVRVPNPNASPNPSPSPSPSPSLHPQPSPQP